MTVVVGGFFVTGAGGGCVSSGLGGVTGAVVGSSGGVTGRGFGVTATLVGVAGAVEAGGRCHRARCCHHGTRRHRDGRRCGGRCQRWRRRDRGRWARARLVAGCGGWRGTAVRGTADVGIGVVSVRLTGVIRASRSCSQAIVTPIAVITAASSATATRTRRRRNPSPSGDRSRSPTATRSSSGESACPWWSR